MAKAKQVQSWGDIPQETFEAFYKAVEKLREEMIPRDCDGDHPIDILISNRMTHEPMSYFPVPRAEVYSYVTHNYLRVHPDKLQEMRDETERWLAANCEMAGNALERYMNLKRHDNERARNAKRPIADRIKEACPLCKKKIGFDPSLDFYQKTRESQPDFPAQYHSHVVVGGEYVTKENEKAKDAAECKAFDLRRKAFYAAHPEKYGEPEPRWCMNPDCRCKLPDHNSKKGVRDKNICVNPRCGKDNSKYYPETNDAKND